MVLFAEVPSDPLDLLPLVAADVPQTDFGTAFGKMILSLLLLIALMGATAWFLRRLIHNRLQKGTPTQSIHILEKRMISPKTMLYLVEVEGKKTLLAESHLEVRKLREWDSIPNTTPPH